MYKFIIYFAILGIFACLVGKSNSYLSTGLTKFLAVIIITILFTGIIVFVDLNLGKSEINNDLFNSDDIIESIEILAL